jgi:hypothetical protein
MTRQTTYKPTTLYNPRRISNRSRIIRESISSLSLVFSLLFHALQLLPLTFDFGLVPLDLLLLLLVGIFMTLELIAN